MRDARYLDLIPANVIIDRRNPVPTINLPNEHDSPAEITTVTGGIETHPFNGSYEAPTLTLPSLALYEPTVTQRVSSRNLDREKHREPSVAAARSKIRDQHRHVRR